MSNNKHVEENSPSINNEEIVRSSKRTKITEFQTSFGIFCKKDDYLVDLFSITPTTTSDTFNEKELNLSIFRVNRGEKIEIRDGKSVKFGGHYDRSQLQINFESSTIAQEFYVAWEHLKRNRNEQSFMTENFEFNLHQTAIPTLREYISEKFKLDYKTPPSYPELPPPSPSIELTAAFSTIQLDTTDAAPAAATAPAADDNAVIDSSPPPSYEFLMNSKQN